MRQSAIRTSSPVSQEMRAIGQGSALLISAAALVWIGTDNAAAAIPPSGPEITPIVKQFPLPKVLPGVPLLRSVSVGSSAQGGAVVPFANVYVSIVITNLSLQPG